MKKMITLGMFLILTISCNSGSRVDISNQQKTGNENSAEIQYKSELDEIRKNIKGETKIKVKKDGKGYSWEITGKDHQEVLKVNDALRKRLGD